MQLLCSFVTPVMTVGHMVSFTVVTPGSAWSCALGSFVFGQQWSSGAVVMSWLVAFTELSGGAPRWGHGRLHIKVRACLEIKQRFGNVRSVYLLLRRTRSPEPSEFCIYSFFLEFVFLICGICLQELQLFMIFIVKPLKMFADVETGSGCPEWKSER